MRYFAYTRSLHLRQKLFRHYPTAQHGVRLLEMDQQNLEHLRQEIDSIDKSILELLSSRFAITREIGELKKLHNLPLQASDREEHQFEQFSKLAKELNVPEQLVLVIYRNIIDTVLHEHRQHYADSTTTPNE